VGDCAGRIAVRKHNGASTSGLKEPRLANFWDVDETLGETAERTQLNCLDIKASFYRENESKVDWPLG
jgi:hypothetical protein